MFSEMLTHSEEKIFLEAIDQYFEKEYFEDDNLNNILDNNNKSNKDKTDQNIDVEKETDIELMNTQNPYLYSISLELSQNLES